MNTAGKLIAIGAAALVSYGMLRACRATESTTPLASGSRILLDSEQEEARSSSPAFEAHSGVSVRSALPQEKPSLAVDAPVRIQVLGPSERPIQSAHVWSRSVYKEEIYSRLGLADSEGVVVVDSFKDERLLVATHPDFTAQEHRVSGSAPGSVILLRVGAAETIRGKVIDRQGNMVTSRPWILGHPDGSPPTKTQVHHAMRAAAPAGPAALTRADAEGSFVLQGLRPGVPYTLWVGGPGHGTPEPLRGVLAGTQDLAFEVSRTFAAHIHFLDARDGRPVRTDARLWGPGSPMWTWDPDDVSSIGADSLVAVLLGVPLEFTERRLTEGRATVLLFADDQEAMKPVAIQVSAALLGYEAKSASLTIPRYVGEISTVALYLDATTSAWGSVRITFQELGTRRGDLCTQVQAIGNLWLAPLRSGGAFAVPLGWFDGEELSLDGVPDDDYRITLSTQGGFAGFLPRTGPMIPVRGEPTQVVFDLGAAAELELLVVASDGGLYSGELAIHLGRADSSAGGGEFLSFRSAPYVLQGLLERSYTVTVFRPTYTGQIYTAHLDRDLDEWRRAYLAITL